MFNKGKKIYVYNKICLMCVSNTLYVNNNLEKFTIFLNYKSTIITLWIELQDQNLLVDTYTIYKNKKFKAHG